MRTIKKLTPDLQRLNVCIELKDRKYRIAKKVLILRTLTDIFAGLEQFSKKEPFIKSSSHLSTSRAR
jgi:hypothetical protein